jgi:hypothetical protein
MRLDFYGHVFLGWSESTEMKTSEQTVSCEKSASQIRIKINPWLFLWTVVGAWMWTGILHLASKL